MERVLQHEQGALALVERALPLLDAAPRHLPPVGEALGRKLADDPAPAAVAEEAALRVELFGAPEEDAVIQVARVRRGGGKDVRVADSQVIGARTSHRAAGQGNPVLVNV